ncbi:MAG: Chromosome partition protein Smc [Mycoplasmataceae bacterium]|nr:MAG: Chromosome partition protein Smc [Mycoplasmataceae bacterium]
MIKINRGGVPIYADQQILDQKPIEVQKIINLPESFVEIKIEGDKLSINSLDSAQSSCLLSSFPKGDIINEKENYLKELNQIQTILNKFKQPIPEGFIKIETDYLFSTKSKWNKPLCERYGFIYQEKWIQIDTPHQILEKLELKKGKEITDGFYLNPNVLTRSEDYGAITITSETEIFLDKSLTINNLEKSLTEWITKINQLTEQIKELKEKDEINQEIISDLQKERDIFMAQISNLKRDLIALFWPNDFYNKDDFTAKDLTREIKRLIRNLETKENEVSQLKNQISAKDKKINDLKIELSQKETWIDPSKRLTSEDERKLGVVDKVYEEWWKKDNDELSKLKLRIDPTWKKFERWCEKNIYEKYSYYGVREEKKNLYPNLVAASFQLFYLSVKANNLPSLDVKKNWSQLIPYNFAFGDAVRRTFRNQEYQQFGEIFNEWRKETLIPNPY